MSIEFELESDESVTGQAAAYELIASVENDATLQLYNMHGVAPTLQETLDGVAEEDIETIEEFLS